jgi:hypothetical protein
MMNRVFALAAVSMLFWSADTALGDAGIVLCKDGVSEYSIVLNPGASASEQFAAKELQEHFKLCTGVELAIKDASALGETPMIVLGCGELSKKLGVDPSREQTGDQGCLIQTTGKNLVIAGTKEVGTLNGIYRFLEDYLGVRWYAPGATKTPSAKTITLPEVKRVVRPAFLYRTTTYAWPDANADFRVRVGRNDGKNDGTDQHGIQYFNDGICHSYFAFIDPKDYFKDHPEYFSEIGGVRISEQTQLCLTNSEVLEIVTKGMLQHMKDMPYGRQHNFSQMDWFNGCQCDKCKAINEKYQTEGGTQFWFVNQLAERTSKVYPDKLIGTLAYQFTEAPPKDMKMHPNVAVWLCHMFPCCDSHPIAKCPKNAVFKQRAAEWSKICSHLFVWHYIVDFAHYYNPFPNFGAMSADLRFYHQIGVEGLFLQGMGHEGGGGEFSLLRPWYAMKLAWDPDQDADKLIGDFLEGYYGPAAKPIREYIAMLQDKVDKDNIHMHLYTNPGQGYLPDEILDRAEKLFDKARAAVGEDATLLDRVLVARMPLTYARLFPRNGFKIENQQLTFVGKKGTLGDATAFVKMMGDHKFQNIREFGNDPKSLLMLAQLINSTLDVITLQSETLSADVVPMLGGRVLRVIHKPTGQCVTSYNVVPRLMFPFTGGIDDEAGMMFGGIGGTPPTVAEKTDRSVVLESQVFGGLGLRRSIKLADKSPVLELASTLTNSSDKPRRSRLRNHLILNLGDLRKTQIRFNDQTGKTVNVSMDEVIAGLRTGIQLYKDDRPKGQIRLGGTKGLELIQSFDDSKVESARIFAYPEELNELELELSYRHGPLPPGQSVTVEQKIEIRPITGVKP